MKLYRKLSVALAGGVVAALAVSGCAPSAPDTSAAPSAEGEGLVIEGETIADQELLDEAVAEGGLTLYTVLAEAGSRAVAARFTEDTGIPVSIVRGATAETASRFLTEFDAGQATADIIQLTDPKKFDEFAAADAVVEFEADITEPIVATGEIDPNGYYYPMFGYTTGIVYNEAALPDGVTIESWEDLLDPALRGRVGTIAAWSGSSGWAPFLFAKEELSDDWWEDFAANDPVILPSAVTVGEQVGRGELLAGIAGENVYAINLDAGAPVAFAYEAEGLISAFVYQAQTSNAPHPAAAELYERWILSEHGQNATAELLASRAVRDDANPPVFGSVELADLSQSTLWYLNAASEPDRWTPEYAQEWEETFGSTAPTG